MQAADVREVLVLTQGYPSAADPYNLAYVHSRNLQYLSAGVRPTVLHFGATEAYSWQGVEVISEADFERTGRQWSLWFSHAPNLRNHLRFLLRHRRAFQKLCFFIHGHEALIKAQHYPPPYAFSPQANPAHRFLDAAYDRLKVRLLGAYCQHEIRRGRLELVFVSEWMRQAFLQAVPIATTELQAHSQIIPNTLHPLFLQQRYRPATEFAADFVTLRPLDNPKYGVDLVRALAQRHPDLRFAVYGQGQYFQHFAPPPNLTHHDRFLTHAEILEILPRYRCALMPTRLDAQGVMMCELAAYGMPLLTSDLPICHEMLQGFEQVGYFANAEALGAALDLRPLLAAVTQHDFPLPQTKAAARFGVAATIDRELALIQGE